MFAADPLERAIQARYARWICAAGSGENVKLCLYLLLGTGNPLATFGPATSRRDRSTTPAKALKFWDSPLKRGNKKAGVERTRLGVSDALTPSTR
jgi:hypothetical protein